MTTTATQINATHAEITRRESYQPDRLKIVTFGLFPNNGFGVLGFLHHDAHGRWTGYSRSGVRLFENNYGAEREMKARLLEEVQRELIQAVQEPECKSCGVVLCSKTCDRVTPPDLEMTAEEIRLLTPKYCDGCEAREAAEAKYEHSRAG